MSEAVKAKNGGNTLKLLILIVFLLILVGGAAFGGYYMASKSGTKTTSTAAAENKTIDEVTVAAGDFLVNLADTDSKRYLKIKLDAAYDSTNSKLPKELEKKQDIIKDCVISVLRTKKAADLTAVGAEDLKKDLLTRVNSVLTTGKLTNVYYVDFLVQ